MRCRTGYRNAESVVPMPLSLSWKQFSLQTVEPSASVQRGKMFTSSVFSTLIKGKLASLSLGFLSGKSSPWYLSPHLSSFLPSRFIILPFFVTSMFLFPPFLSPNTASFPLLFLLSSLPIFSGTCWMAESKNTELILLFQTVAMKP